MWRRGVGSKEHKHSRQRRRSCHTTITDQHLSTRQQFMIAFEVRDASCSFGV